MEVVVKKGLLGHPKKFKTVLKFPLPFRSNSSELIRTYLNLLILRGTFVNFLGCPSNPFLTTTTLKSAQEKVLKNDNSIFLFQISHRRGHIHPSLKNFLREENVRFRFRSPRKRS